MEASLQILEVKHMEKKLTKLKLKHERSSHSIHGTHHSPRRSSKDSSHAHNHGEDYGRRRHHHHSHGESYNREQRHHQEAKPQLSFVKVPSFSGYSDPNVYLDRETKVDHIFHVYKVQDDHKLGIVSLSILDYAKEWWYDIVMDIIYSKRPPVVSWNDL